MTCNYTLSFSSGFIYVLFTCLVSWKLTHTQQALLYYSQFINHSPATVKLRGEEDLEVVGVVLDIKEAAPLINL